MHMRNIGNYLQPTSGSEKNYSVVDSRPSFHAKPNFRATSRPTFIVMDVCYINAMPLSAVDGVRGGGSLGRIRSAKVNMEYVT